MEKQKEEVSWNYKRIFIALFLLAFLIIGGYYLKANYLGETTSTSQENNEVKGVSAEEENLNKNTEEVNIDIKGAVKDKLNDLKTDVSNLNIAEIASSSPQIQKIINDIKSLEKYPENQVKEICKQICSL